MAKVTLHPVTSPEDYFAEAKMEAEAFRHSAFDNIAFGMRRFDDDYCAKRAKGMAKQPGKGQVIKTMKAVSEKGEIVGFATWGVVSVAEGGRGVGIYGVGKELKDGEEKEDEEKKEEVKREEAKEDGVKLVQCQKLLDDTFISGDIAMAEACKGGDYYKLYTLIVSPEHQRQGIGALLLEGMLEEADEQGIQCVLGASPEGFGLYTKYGFVVVKYAKIELGEYGDGEIKGIMEHRIMYRRARELEAQSDHH